MKISFILPCHNVEDYVRKCVDSIIAMGEADIEIIAVNDGSTDNTLNILNELKNQHGIKIISFDNASGFAGRPRNAGIEAASGEYLAFIDPDDYYLGNELIKAYEKYQGNDIIVNSFKISNPQGKILDKIVLKDANVDRCKFLWRQVVNVCNQRSLYKRSFINSHNIRFYEDCIGEDLLFLYTTYVNGAKIRTTKYITTMYIDDRVGSLSTVISSHYIESSILAYERFFNLINKNLCSKEVNSAIGEHFLGYYLKVRTSISSKQKELIMSTNFYKHIKKNIVKVK
ncbi:glycosyltransferase family 2 protein [Mollicutes bacterium LVI A0078]|nr:glycosyltransferase family 2 protein [Mollicutes bacterium LVI A0075]WOO91499.1 glycosyltransferase family 2 protein [Mollicutes bacterium LVI A0078]